jgi:hypothetical protein
MSDKIKRLLETLSEGEQQLLATPFLAPCVRGGKVRTRLNGLVYTFRAKPRDFEGWGIFQPASARTAALIEEASLPLVLEYLKLFKPLRARLAHQLQSQSWLAYPVNESDARQRFGSARPFVLHLVEAAAQFEQVRARYDGSVYWFEDVDRSGDPLIAEWLRDQAKNLTLPENLAFNALTPESRTVYDIALQQTAEFRREVQQRRDEGRLKKALDVAGGELKGFRDRGDYWTVEWTTREGERLNSAILKSDLTVMSSGICLSGRDRDFDLTSLVGVVERSNDWD